LQSTGVIVIAENCYHFSNGIAGRVPSQFVSDDQEKFGALFSFRCRQT